jgi:hypothetical protein
VQADSAPTKNNPVHARCQAQHHDMYGSANRLASIKLRCMQSGNNYPIHGAANLVGSKTIIFFTPPLRQAQGIWR